MVMNFDVWVSKGFIRYAQQDLLYSIYTHRYRYACMSVLCIGISMHTNEMYVWEETNPKEIQKNMFVNPSVALTRV